MEGEPEGSDGDLEIRQMSESPVAGGASVDPKEMLQNNDKSQDKALDRGMEAEDLSEGDESRGWRRKAEGGSSGPRRWDNSREWSGMEWRTKESDSSERRGGFRGFSMSRRGGGQSTRPPLRGRRGNYVKYRGVGRTFHALQLSTLDFEELQELSTKEPSVVAVRVSSHPALKALLGESTMREDLLEMLCPVLSKAFRSRADRGSLQHLAGLIRDSGFLRTVLPHYLAGIGSEADAARRERYPQQLESILVILTQVLNIFPASSVDAVSLLLALLPPSICSLRTSGVNIPAQIEENMGHLQHLVKHLQTRSREGTLRSNRDTYALLPTDEEQQDFRTIPIYPTPEELRHEERPYLRPNLTSQRYPSTHLYLDTHFRLLREDFVRPLREGIQELLSTQMNIGQMDNPANQVKGKRFDDIRMYHDTKVIAPECTSSGLAYIVQFDVEPLKFVRWENSKRLIFGSLVCLSCDNFESFLFATVSFRDTEELQNGFVHIIFTEESRNRLATLKENQAFLMVETTAYFEAYRYVLEGLQEQEEDELPFKKYLVDCCTDVSPPAYLHRGDTYDLSSVAHPDFKSKIKVFPALDTKAWPTVEELGLDESQFKAFQLALTKEIAIIQGPPGTGKTYVGLKIAQALLTNGNLWQSTAGHGPILVVCYTNHALDQFLEGIFTFLKKGIVRVGGRSSSEILKGFNLRELSQSPEFRNKIPNHLITSYHTIFSVVRETESDLEAQSMQLECIFKGVLHESVLQRFISEPHWDRLHTVHRDDVFQVWAGKKASVIMEWLDLLQIQMDTTPSARDVQAEDVAFPEETLIRVDDQAELLEAERDVDGTTDSKGRRDNSTKANSRKAVERRLLAMSLDEPEEKYQKVQKKKLKNKIKRELRATSTMTEEEERAITDVWTLSILDKWRLYRMWVERYRVELRTKSLLLEQQYQNAVDRLADVKRQQNLCILKGASVIGMTTTGAAKYRHSLQQVRPSLVIVEEAAEVLEAHTITTLSSACQHLILIGDHQQLRPSATVYELAKNFNLEMSMFERLVNMGLPFARLDYQHRMRPDIARLLTPHIYSELENHPSVLEYENIKGLNTNLFFVEHTHLEEELRDGKSHENKHEAQFVVALCRYLMLQEYKPEQITILTTYTGQLFCLRKLMPASQFSGVKVHVVDKYQGEENDIVLLSLVRSNLEHRVGFLNIPNRVCVALSRAKKGLYCIGNSEMLGQVKLWSNIFHTLREKDQIGTALTLCCQNHPARQVRAASAADFEQAPEGGCTQPCEYRLECGHVCPKACHPYDPEHKQNKCMKKCQKILCDLGHGCPQLCYETCNKCNVLVEKTVPQCQHKQMVPCHQDPATFVCQEPCPKTLRCGHPCDQVCGKSCTTSCKVEIHYELKCGHKQKDFCFYKTQQKEPDCTTPCKQQLKCGHVCRGKCSLCHSGRYHCDCSHKCERLLICSHKCQSPCTTCPPCTRKCQNRCVHSQCSNPCGQPCSPCVEPCAWQCPHQTCTKLCHEPCDRPPCNEPCDETLPCGHPCIGLCGEKCPDKCRVCHREEVTEIFFGFEDDPESRFIQLQDCGHVIERRALDQFMQMDQTQQENEEEVAIKLKECPKCRTPIRKNLRYGSHINRCLAEIELVKQKISEKREDVQADVMQKQRQAKEFKEESLWFSEFSTRSADLLKIVDLGTCSTASVQIRYSIMTFRKWLKNSRQRFTEQQVFDLERELRRLTLLTELDAIVTEQQYLQQRNKYEMKEETVRDILGKCGQFTEDDEAGVKPVLEELRNDFSCLGISVEETKIPLSPVHLPGQWFRCVSGHVYFKTENEGTMEKPQCPECKANMGAPTSSKW